MQDEIAIDDERDKLGRRAGDDGRPGFGRESFDLISGLDEERVDAVAQPTRAWRGRAQRMYHARWIAGFLQQFASAAFGGILVGIDEAGWNSR